MSQKYYPQGNDYWGLNGAGWKEYQLLISDPKLFFIDIFKSPYQDAYGGFFNSVGSYWNDLKNTLLGKLLACINILSRGNYYSNSLFLNFIGFFGHVALFRVFANIYPWKKWPVIVGCFLLPSALYFSSGIHKDLLVFTMLGLFCYALYFSLKYGFKAKYIFTIIFTFSGLLLIRNYVAMAILPAGVAWILSIKLKVKPWVVFTSLYFALFIVIAVMEIFSPSFQPLKIITQKQADFFALPIASTQLEKQLLEPNTRSFIKNAPQALNHGLLRPYLWEQPTKFLVPLAIELFIYQVLFILSLYKRDKSTIDAFIFFGLFLAFSLLLFTGYIVPNIGSVVRYRSLYLPFLITPVLCAINWQKRHA